MTKNEIVQTIKGAPAYVKEHWKKPAEGEYLSLSETVAYIITQAGSYIMLTVSGIMTFAATYFCGSIMGIANLDFSIINIITTVVNYIFIFMNPISMLIYENHGILPKKTKIFAHCAYSAEIVLGILFYFIPSAPFEFIIKGLPQLVANIFLVSGVTGYINWFIRYKFCAKHGRYKPFILICGLPAALLMSVIPFLPVQNLDYTTKLIVLHLIFSFMNWFYQSYVGVQTLVTFLTPNSQERQKLYSIVPIITGLIPSIISIFFPMLIGLTGGYLSLTTYKVFVPIFAITGAVVSLAAVKCKERVIEPPMEKRKKVTFFEGAKNVLKNKYLWIVNISNTLGVWQGLVTNLLGWWFIYSLRMEWFSGVASQIVVLGYTFGGILTPILTKKFQKRTILLVFRGITLLTIFGAVIAVSTESIVIFMVAMFIRNTIAPIVDGINAGLTADIMIYHHWKYGERADSMSGVFGWMFNPISVGISLILPSLLKNVGYTSDWDVLFDSAILHDVFNIYTWLSIIGMILITVPFLFYDLTKEKYDTCVRELEERVKAIENEERVEEVV